jgi:hypothetical protein
MNDSTNRDYLIWSNERVKAYDMSVLARENYQKENQAENVPLRS